MKFKHALTSFQIFAYSSGIEYSPGENLPLKINAKHQTAAPVRNFLTPFLNFIFRNSVSFAFKNKNT